jgi:transposase
MSSGSNAAAVDDPSRITKSKAVGALFGLTPKKYQSGEKDVTGGITRTGDEMVRTALYEAANVLLSRITRFSKLKRWGMDVAKRRRMADSEPKRSSGASTRLAYRR